MGHGGQGQAASSPDEEGQESGGEAGTPRGRGLSVFEADLVVAPDVEVPVWNSFIEFIGVFRAYRFHSHLTISCSRVSASLRMSWSDISSTASVWMTQPKLCVRVRPRSAPRSAPSFQHPELMKHVSA